MLNRVVGLGVDGPVDEAQLDDALTAMGDTSFYVAVSPSADASLDGLLEARGLEPGWGWMLFERGPSPAPSVETALRIVEVDARHSRRVGRPSSQPPTVFPTTRSRGSRRSPRSPPGTRFSRSTATSPPLPPPSGSTSTLPTSEWPGPFPSTVARAVRARSSPPGSSERSQRAARRSSPRRASCETGARARRTATSAATDSRSGSSSPTGCAAAGPAERAGYAHPVTSQRLRAKRAPIVAARTTMRTASAAQTPRTPKSPATTTPSDAVHARNAATIDPAM